ncbi:hypothetical protein D7D52_08815 [Nocardia yunnanensis]|uniref:DUF8020 domain-containing protein n=1 Tax=Nocardia yunnanensis TaxID=2382165 RepID=A0A386Z8I4_9NOCA|nr:hypothetical protein [Nocardia yunnanensis]AYF73950.1 hypothetical protein D7D52_08815 [Nocardia yunnanensis]
MRTFNAAIVAALTTAALAVTAGVANAEPAQPDPAARPSGLHFTAQIVDRTVTVSTDGGTLTAADGRLSVRDAEGTVLEGIPLTYHRDGKTWPIDAEIHDHTAVLTPVTDPARAIADTAPAVPAALTDTALHDIGIDWQSTDFNASVMNFATMAGIGVTLGTLIGTVVGAVIGCVAGGLVAGAAATAMTIGALTIPGFLGGCLVTGAALGAIGAVIGNIFIAGPLGGIGALQFLDAMNRQANK